MEVVLREHQAEHIEVALTVRAPQLTDVRA